MTNEFRMPSESSGRLLNNLGFWFLFATLLGVATYIRFATLTDIGMHGYDVFQYYNFAEKLLGDEPVLLFYRPVVYLLFFLSFKIFGFTDFAPKVMVNLFDIGNIILIWLVGKAILKNRFAALAPATLYAFLRPVMVMNRVELCHVFSTTFVLLFLLAVVSYLFSDKRKGLHVFLAGMWVGLAAHTHEDLAALVGFLGGLVLVLCLVQRSRTNAAWAPTFRQALTHGGLALAGTLLPVLIGLSYFGFAEVYENISKLRQVMHGKETGHPALTTFFTLLPTFVRENLGRVLSKLYWICAGGFAATCLVRLFLKKPWNSLWLGLLVLLVLPYYYVAAYSIAVGNVSLARLFFPFLPCLLIFVIGCGLGFLSFVRVPISASAPVLVGLSIVFACFQKPQWVLDLPPSNNRQIYDALKNDVNAQRRLLIPISFLGTGPMWGGSPGYGVLGRMYFGDNAIALFHVQSDGSFEQIIEKHHIGFVLVCDVFGDYRDRDFRQGAYFNDVFGHPVTDALVDSNQAAMELEKKLLLEHLAALQATEHARIPGLGVIYALPGVRI